MKSRKNIALVCGALVVLLSACKDPNSLELALGNDWINHPPVADPSPTPTVSPTPTPTPSSTPVDLYTGPAEVEKYVLKFVDDAKIQGIDVVPDMQNPKLEVQISTLDYYGSSVIGLCETSGTRRRVTFDPDFWDSVSETQREILAHHELGHCVLYRDHRSDLLSGGLYASIMYPIIMSSSSYTNNYDYYQEELFAWGALSSEGRDTGTVHICDHTNI